MNHDHDCAFQAKRRKAQFRDPCFFHPAERRAAHWCEVHAEAQLILGSTGEWRVCGVCALLPFFDGYRRQHHLLGRSAHTPVVVISGGQTGVDRAGLDFAIAHGIAHGGFCPKGRLAEDGAIPHTYNMRETKSPGYASRTKKNVGRAAATLIIYDRELGPGSAQTRRHAEKLRRPVLCVDLEGEGYRERAFAINEFLKLHRPPILNVAGSRESRAPGIYKRARELLCAVWGLDACRSARE